MQWFNSFGRKPRVKVLPPREGPVVIERSKRPYWEEQGWERRGNTYRGFYRSRFGSFEGKIDGGRFYILEPPAELQYNAHWPCFQHVGDGWYHVHFSERPKDVDSGIWKVEQILSEAIAHAL